jgi:hypothetical protein
LTEAAEGFLKQIEANTDVGAVGDGEGYVAPEVFCRDGGVCDHEIHAAADLEAAEFAAYIAEAIPAVKRGLVGVATICTDKFPVKMLAFEFLKEIGVKLSHGKTYL